MLAARYWRRTFRLRAQPPHQGHALDAEIVLRYSSFHPGPRGKANHIPGVGETSLALVLASKATQSLKSTWIFGRCDRRQQGSSHHHQD